MCHRFQCYSANLWNTITILITYSSLIQFFLCFFRIQSSISNGLHYLCLLLQLRGQQFPDTSTVLRLTQNRSTRPVVIRSLWSTSFSSLWALAQRRSQAGGWTNFTPLRKPGVMRKLDCQEASAALVGCRVSPCCGLVWTSLRTAYPPPTLALHTYKTWRWVTI